MDIDPANLRDPALASGACVGIRQRATRRPSAFWGGTGAGACDADLGEPAKLGAGIAVAFIATIYGVGSANLIFLPSRAS